MGIPGDNGGAEGRAAISVFAGATGSSTNIFIQTNIVKKAGYAGIEWTGSGVLIENNFIDSICMIKDDAGGIYTFNSRGRNHPVFSNRIIRNNIILHSLGDFRGTNLLAGKGRGIYNDENTNNVIIKNNIVGFCSSTGLYNNTTYSITFDSNIVFNCNQAWQVNRFKNENIIHDMRFTNNQYFPLVATYSDLSIDSPYTNTIDKSLQRGIVSDSNRYFTTTTGTLTTVQMKNNNTGYSLVSHPYSYLTGMGLEANSKVTFSANDDLILVYNATNVTAMKNIPGTCEDINGASFKNTITLAPFTGKVLKRL